MAGLVHRVLVTALLVSIPGLGCGATSRGNDSDDSGGSSGSSSTRKSCVLDGKTYEDGESIPSQDGCNTCSCSNGEIGCTAVACFDGCLHQGMVYEPFEQFPAGDGCNSCHCLESGSISCTMVECAVCADIQREYAAALDQAKRCDPDQPNQCSKTIIEGLACGCDAFVNPEQAESIAEAEALGEQYAEGECAGQVLCGACLPPLSARCSAEGRCEPVHEAGNGAACKVQGVVYPSGTANIPDAFSCNTCDCVDGRLVCTEIACETACPPDRVPHTQCAECGAAGGCEVVEHACLPVCDGTCESGACVEGVCRTLCR